MIGAALRRITRERAYAAAIILSWALAFILASLMPASDGSGDSLTLVSRNLPDYMGVFILVSVPACAYVFGKALQSRTASLEICSGNSRFSVFAVHIVEFLAMVLFVCLSSSALACFRLVGSAPDGLDGLAFRAAALGCACVAMASPVCLALVLLRDVLRAVVASVLVVLAELWSMALLAHPYISPCGDLAQNLPPQVLAHPVVALKMAVLPGAATGQLLLVVCFCVGLSVIFLLTAYAVWSRAELR